MNFSGSMALSLFIHGALAVAVIAAPPADEEPHAVLDRFVQERVVEFQPQGAMPERFKVVEVARADQGEPEEPEPEIEPEPEPKPDVTEKVPEERPEKPAPEPETEPAPTEPTEEAVAPPPKAEIKPVVASADSSSPAEVKEAATAAGGVTNGRIDGVAGARPNTGNNGQQTGTSRGRDRGSDGVDRRALLKAWLKQIYVEVQKHQRYPRAARRSRQEGKVTLKVWIAPNGDVKRVVVHDSSGHSTLDRSALQLIESITPLPSPPTALRWGTRPIKLPVTYRLR